MTDAKAIKKYIKRLDRMAIEVMNVYEERGKKTIGEYAETVTQVAVAHLNYIDDAAATKFDHGENTPELLFSLRQLADTKTELKKQNDKLLILAEAIVHATAGPYGVLSASAVNLARSVLREAVAQGGMR